MKHLLKSIRVVFCGLALFVLQAHANVIVLDAVEAGSIELSENVFRSDSHSKPLSILSRFSTLDFCQMPSSCVDVRNSGYAFFDTSSVSFEVVQASLFVDLQKGIFAPGFPFVDFGLLNINNVSDSVASLLLSLPSTPNPIFPFNNISQMLAEEVINDLTTGQLFASLDLTPVSGTESGVFEIPLNSSALAQINRGDPLTPFGFELFDSFNAVLNFSSGVRLSLVVDEPSAVSLPSSLWLFGIALYFLRSRRMLYGFR